MYSINPNRPIRTLRELVNAALVLVDGAADGLEHVPAVLRARQAGAAWQVRWGCRHGCQGCHSQLPASCHLHAPTWAHYMEAPAHSCAAAQPPQPPRPPSRTLKWSAWLHSEGSHFRHSVPSCSGMGEGRPYGSTNAWPSGTAQLDARGGAWCVVHGRVRSRRHSGAKHAAPAAPCAHGCPVQGACPACPQQHGSVGLPAVLPFRQANRAHRAQRGTSSPQVPPPRPPPRRASPAPPRWAQVAPPPPRRSAGSPGPTLQHIGRACAACEHGGCGWSMEGAAGSQIGRSKPAWAARVPWRCTAGAAPPRRPAACRAQRPWAAAAPAGWRSMLASAACLCTRAARPACPCLLPRARLAAAQALACALR